MFKMNFRGILGCLLAVLVAGMVTTGCYDDSELRSSINDLKTQLQQLQTLVNTLQNDDAVTGVTPNRPLHQQLQEERIDDHPQR